MTAARNTWIHYVFDFELTFSRVLSEIIYCCQLFLSTIFSSVALHGVLELSKQNVPIDEAKGLSSL